ncbi:hypothetical protein [Flexivirga meconopsidis]|uniref:hypothetical protein n=1 Tax=Flexivirga meconopsidis TaxID=2977121 RepID=UPI00223EB8A1|nr:hypothetical protein [Flexivirga meconopsidis]
MSDEQGGFGLSGDQPTGPNTGPTMSNPQDSYYNRYSQSSGEGVTTPQPQKPGGRGKLLIGLATVLAVIVAGVAIFAFTRGGGSDTAAASKSASVDNAPVTATTWTNPTKAAGGRALQPGWQSQTASTYANGQFDVPTQDWKLKEASYVFGFANPKDYKDMITAAAPAMYGVGFCSAKKDQESAWVGLRNVGKRDPSDAGPEIAQKFADLIAMKKDGSKAPQGKISAGKQIKVNQGTLPALEYTITTEIGDPNDCGKGKKYEIRTVTYSTAGESAQLVTLRLLGVSKELPAADLDKIIATFRPAS